MMSEALRKAAAAVIARWDSPDWRDGAHTADYINALRAALAEPEQSKPVAWAATSKYVVGGVAEVHLSFNKPQGDWFASAMPLFAAPPRREPPWGKDDLDGMVEAFSRVIEAQHTKDHPFHNPINADAMTALRLLRGYLPYMKDIAAIKEVLK